MRLVLFAALLLAAPTRGQTLMRAIDYPSPSENARFGSAVAAVPDVDGDGRADLLVGAPQATSAILSQLGRAYAFSSATGVPLDTLVSPNPESNGGFGNSVAGLPDRNGDGRGDYLIGGWREDVGGQQDAGRAYVMAGLTETVLSAHVSPNAQPFSRQGQSVCVVPDVSGDGRPDYAVAATSEAGARGRVYLYSGADGSLLRTIANPGTEGWSLGRSMAGLPDADGDGRGDLILTAEPNGALGFGRGAAYMVSGATGALLQTFSPGTLEDFIQFNVGGLPDVDGDGRGDLAVTVVVPDLSQRLARVYSGATGTLLRTIVLPDFPSALAGLDDVNGDGAGDLLVGMSTASQGSTSSAGAVAIYSGRTGASLLSLAPPNAQQGGNFGSAVAAVPDLTADGRPELLIGAPGESVAGFADAGRIYLYTTSGIVDTPAAPPAEAALRVSVSPTPAAGAATVSFALPTPADARLTLHDALGRTVATLAAGARAAGAHTLALDAGRLAPGVYLARVVAGAAEATARLVVAR